MEKSGAAFSYTAYREMDPEGVPTDTVVTGPKRITRAGMFRYC